MNLKEVIEIAKEFSGAQWAAIIAIIGSGIYGYNWIENRYAHKDNVEQLLEHVVRIDSKLSALIATQYSEEQVQKINKSAQEFEKHLREYAGTNKSK